MYFFQTIGDIREFASVISAEENPLDGGYLVPAGAYEDPPPPYKQGFTIVRSPCLTKWEYLQDHRNKVFYYKENGELFLFSQSPRGWTGLGEIPNFLTEEKPIIKVKREDVVGLRSALYSENSDPLLIEALRMKYMDEDGWDDKMQEAFAAYHSIREENPFPEE